MRRVSGVILAAVIVIVMVFSSACERRGDGRASTGRVLVLGIDGMDPTLLEGLMRDGRMPNFAALAQQGDFLPLATSAPPQSPVAWSNFIAGADPGTHQIYDFVHRDPHPASVELAIEPYLSTSRVEPPHRDWALSLGHWRIPLFGSETVSLRRGDAFWNHLVDAGVATTIYRVPANFPPPTLKGSEPFRCLCGMGTPDLQGTYGEFTMFRHDVPRDGVRVSGGRFAPLRLRDHRGVGVITGPANFLHRGEANQAPPAMTAAVHVVRDPERPVARIEIGDDVALLNEGEWSDWMPIEFSTEIPGSSVLNAMQLPTSMGGMVRLYLRQVHPMVELYVSPVNIDPLNQVNPIGSGDLPEDVARATGRYYTTGIPEDTKALRSGALNEDEFLAQVQQLKDERFRQYANALEHFDEGFLFFYFGHIDQLSHIFWRDRDPGHPAHDPDEAARYGGVIDDAYVEMDKLLGMAMNTLGPDDTIIVMSDHGFTSFRYGFNLNTWLRANGYLELEDPSVEHGSEYLLDVDWSQTKAYALGLNALYLNIAGREKHGIVTAGERDALIREIIERLQQQRDADGRRIVDVVHVTGELYPGADDGIAPDLLIGYADTYRSSWENAEGAAPAALIEVNDDRWSGDHCCAAHLVPGVLLSNQPVAIRDPNLTDLAPTILRLFDIDKPATMTGRDLLDSTR